MLMSCHVLETQILEQYTCFLLTVELMCVNIDRTYQIPGTAQLIAWENSGQHESSVGQLSLTRVNTPRVWLEPHGRRSMHRSLWPPNSCLIRGCNLQVEICCIRSGRFFFFGGKNSSFQMVRLYHILIFDCLNFYFILLLFFFCCNKD